MMMMKNPAGNTAYPTLQQPALNPGPQIGGSNKMVDFSNLTNILLSSEKSLKIAAQDQQQQQQQLELARKLSSQNTNANSSGLNYAASYLKKPVNNRQSPFKQNSIQDLMTLLKRLGEPFYHMSFYLCSEAIELFEKLPHNHYKTGWVLCNIGKCYMEIIKYSEAEKFYAEALNIEPYRLEGVHFYSSCLWHLKKQVILK
jgi:tetratricopeptide (TPR) repeat protein